MTSADELIEEALSDLEEHPLKMFHWHLKKYEGISNSEMEKADRLDTVDKMVACFGPEKAVKITVDILRKINQNHLAEQLENKQTQGVSSAALHDYREFSPRLKNKLKHDYERIFVGNPQTGHQKYLNDIYTDLYVVENETGGIVNDHEVRQTERNFNQSDVKDTPIQCNNIFKVNMDRRNRKVLTMGIAGIGKTVSVSKLILNWVESKENQDIDFIFPLPFRRLNLIKEDYSLLGLMNKYFFSSHGKLTSLPEGDGKVMFIFDGLDECRFPLDFKDDGFTDVNEKTSVSKIITNLIRNHLVPSALIWITSRPAAASLVPRKYIDQVTEVRGFNNEQKEQYFKNNSSPQVAENIIDHIKKSRSLYIMCHIPVFCWISLTVLQPLAQRRNDKTPMTLTGMYTSFLLTQQQQMKNKYGDKPNNKNFDEVILKLGKLAFQQLQQGNLIFYKKDLEECGLCVDEGSVSSGLCTQIFQEENAFAETMVYSFIHLSVQEFLAALYVYFKNKDKKANPFLEWRKTLTCTLSRKPLFELHKAAINKALQSENGHLDLFLRFLLGLSLESNQEDLKKLLPGLELKPETLKDTTDYIKQKIEMEISAERTINLFHCLNELKDNFVEEMQKNLSSGNISAQSLSSAQWWGLVFVLLMSEETQEIFELQKYRRSDEALVKLLPVIKNTRRARLNDCGLTEKSCAALSSVLKSETSMKELDMNNNDLQDSGVKLLCDGLKNFNCKLEILRLSNCSFTEEGCTALASAVRSNPSHLIELDLTGNDPGPSGVKELSDLLQDPHCQLKTLRLQSCNLTAQSCESLSSALQSLKSVLRNLDLSNNDLQDSGVKLLSDGLKSPNCQLEILRLSGCMVTEEGCGYVSSALSSNPSRLRELDLSYNHPGDSGVKLLSEKLKDPTCSLHKLNVDHGGELRITAGLKKWACFLTLDPNTVSESLRLSEENRRVTYEGEKHSYTDHPDRFDVFPQVLCGESVCGRCFWETEWRGDVSISVSYKSIRRKGGGYECVFGSNDQSWSLVCDPHSYTFSHNHTHTRLPVSPIIISGSGVNGESVCRTGVYVDHSAGTLSFYSRDRDTMILIHSVQTTFTQPLYPGFGFYYDHIFGSGSSVKLC